MKLFKICLTGGPCGGKTTGLSYIEREFTKMGYKVVIINESATELILSGLNSQAYNDNYTFEQNILYLQKLKEELYTKACLKHKGFENEEIALCYHCNFGYPLVNENAVMTHVPAEIAALSAPIHGKTEECLKVPFENQDEVTVGIKNEKIFASITYKTATLPNFLIWKMKVPTSEN